MLQRRFSGFSFVELAIVLVAVGLILGAVLLGQEMIDNARMAEVMGKIDRFSVATNQFKHVYDGLPGDVVNMGGKALDNTQDPTSFFPSEPIMINGDGNGIVDSSNYEDLYFWYHLSLSHLYMIDFSIDNVGNITQLYVPATKAFPGSVPAGARDNSGYRVSYDASLGIVFDYGVYSSGAPSVHNAVYSPLELYEMDVKFDDGKPNTGRVRAVGGAACFNLASNSYQVSTTSLQCVMRALKDDPALVASLQTMPYCQAGQPDFGYSIGVSRVVQDGSLFCPTGYRGRVMQTCESDGVWSSNSELRYYCEPVRCSGGAAYGETRTVGCPDSTGGTLTEVCNASGVWVDTGVTSCMYPVVGDPCIEPLVLPCPLGQQGRVQYGCAGTLGVPVDTCSAVSCTGPPARGLGGVRTTACPVNYSGANGNVFETCGYAGSYEATHHTCVPDYGVCPAVGNTRDIGCPAGAVGEHMQRCVAGVPNDVWVTESDSCRPVTCGDAPVGTYRLSTDDVSCPSGLGEVLEVCQADGSWGVSLLNCVQ